MERLIYRIRLLWVLLLGGALLTQYVGWSKLAYWFFVPVVVGLPLMLLAMLRELVLQARHIWWRIQRLRRARKWKRERPSDARWINTWLDDQLN